MLLARLDRQGRSGRLAAPGHGMEVRILYGGAARGPDYDLAFLRGVEVLDRHEQHVAQAGRIAVAQFSRLDKLLVGQ